MDDDSFETNIIHNIQNAGNDEHVAPEDVGGLIRDFFSLVKYAKLRKAVRAAKSDYTIRNNSEFWLSKDLLFEGARVRLESFHLIEWLPWSPGRYFSPEAMTQREFASRLATASEYLPLGKMGMIFGGVGSVRLTAKHTQFGETHFLCATSSGVSHEGIPIAVESAMLPKIMPLIREMGGCRASVVGTLRILEDQQTRLMFDVEVPRYVVVAEDVDVKEPSPQHSLKVSLQIMYSGTCRDYERDSSRSINKGWSFAYFEPGNKASERPLKHAVEWLSDYARRHSVSDSPTIICDFDEHARHFGNPVEFAVADLFRNRFDSMLLGKYSSDCKLSINIDNLKLVVGDIYENISHSKIVNRSNAPN